MFRHSSALESLMLQRPIYPAPASPHGRTLTTEQPSSSLYSGKWTMEEENYVSCLCEEFRAGSLAVPEGKSLRCFLADTLGCNAKRISKKYERTGYHGKLQYVDRRKTMTPEDLQKRQEKMQEFEQKFRESRETLKIVEASRKRPAPSLLSGTPTMMMTNTGLPSHHHALSTVAALQAGLGGAGGIAGAGATAYLPAAKRARTAASILLSTPAPIHHLGGTAASAAGAPSLAALTLPLSTGAGVQAADLLGHSHHAATQDTEPSPSSLLLQRALANTKNKSDIMRASMLAALQKRCDPTSTTTTTTAAGFQLLSRGGTADPPSSSSASALRDHEASPVLPSSRLERLSSVAAILEKAQRQTSITSSSSSKNAAADEDALLDAEVAASSSSALSSTSSIAAGLLAFRHAAAVPAHHITAAHHQLHSN